MKSTIFFDVNGTLTRTISKDAFKVNPRDTEVLPGIKEAIAHYKKLDWQFIGISNQPAIGTNFKTLENTIIEMQFTLELIPELSAIYFSPDFEGLICWRVTKNSSEKIADHTGEDFLKKEFRYAKPGCGMIYQGIFDSNTDKSKSWMIGSHLQDENCAKNAGINFMWADIFRQRFLTGTYEFKNAAREQVAFLENINL